MKLNKKSIMLERANTIRLNSYKYCYGAKYTGSPMTTAKIKALRDANSQVYTPDYYARTLDTCVGHYAIDCSGLVCHIWGIPDIGSYQIDELPETNGADFTLLPYSATAKLEPFDCLWKSGHVGLAWDNSTTFEARSLAAGVGIFNRNDEKWVHIIRPRIPQETPARQVGWYRESDGSWWYSTGTNTGQYYRNTVAEINGELFMFDPEGWLVVSPVIAFNSNGSIKKIEGERYKS